ncbi:PREDICTED: F-box/FBD/LRR-repeat protein At1g13570-like [Nelumbo nucifera]|uniref:FBD domain-containing protein n=2 Tax=Nelumbo nucifera TaxID=4432 RepID=A0A822YL10_NELNU|nr:PREDICTED: F-box/FBD/LRR-repeat protein At1g13570-like [Nelumbo nucifera]DAD31606.1 TPA_asm: hypothetical protein HUJ06_010457 [Nelumbo nucifera]
MDDILVEDIISDLPPIIIEHILVSMPLRDAVRTSILSKKWRYKWVTIPNLKFDDQCIPTHSNAELLVKTEKFVNFVHRSLLLHSGPIHRFEVSVSWLRSCCDVNQWILFLSRNDIREFILNLDFYHEWFTVPSCLFSFQKLNILELHCCTLIPPPTFKGFHSLKNLQLESVVCGNETVRDFISSCPLLEELVLANVEGLDFLQIQAPNLKFLHVDGGFQEIVIQDTPLLRNAVFVFQISDEIADFLDKSGTCNLTKTLNGLVGLESLKIEIMQFFSYGDIPDRLPTTYNDMRNLELSCSFEDEYDISCALCLIRSSPNLRRLRVEDYSDKKAAMQASGLDFWERESYSGCFMSQLQFVSMGHLLGAPHELQFIKFILSNSPALKTMTITPHPQNDRREDMLIQLLQLERASTQAKIMYVKE